jgi:pSer/pThr/pTyr-binding forkhead associated (FHA) protein
MASFREDQPEGINLELARSPLRVGRSGENDVVLADDHKVSRFHLELILRDGTWWAKDCGSRNGTHVNGSRVTEVMLRGGDRIRVGDRQFLFADEPDPFATITEDEPSPAPGVGLSVREREIVALVASGATDVEIADALTIGLSTVHSHLDRIRDKTGRRRRPDLTRLAAELGLDIPPPPTASPPSPG